MNENFAGIRLPTGSRLKISVSVVSNVKAWSVLVQ